MSSNLHVEHINFYVADFNTAYHTILGWLALAKLMAIPHYAYLVLKMPSPAGVLALRANLSIAYAYETESLALAEATDLSIQMASVVTEAKMVPANDMEILELEPPRASAKSKETKEVGLGLDDPSKTVKIGAHLDPQIGKRAHLLPTCQCRCVCLETYRHAEDTTGEDRALLECFADRQAEAPMIRVR